MEGEHKRALDDRQPSVPDLDRKQPLPRTGLRSRRETSQVVQALAYRYIPLIIRDRNSDDDWSGTQRDRLVLEEQVELACVFRALALNSPLWDAYVDDRGGDVFAESSADELNAASLTD